MAAPVVIVEIEVVLQSVGSDHVIATTIFGETARAASYTSGIALAASGVPLPNRRKATS
jgi:hypothetical protein